MAFRAPPCASAARRASGCGATKSYLRGGLGRHATIGRPVIRRVPADTIHFHVERLVRGYLSGRQEGEAMRDFFVRHSDEDLVAMAAGDGAAA